ncbi:MAG TPA: tripartite tricarboxylate transporter substrate-binding protein [Burkholderiales bacterium]|nr:tripartite tricarboxylate transporter substrate-binding protein [Burkholderiales bacterium]
MRVIAAMLAALVSLSVAAQSFPSKTVRLISGVTPGSASDTMARVLSEKMASNLGVPVIVENRLGAGGAVAAKYVATAEPDGHLVMIYTSAFTIAPILNPGSFDPKDLTAVATLGVVPTVMVVNPSKGYKSVDDLVKAAKANPGKLVATNAGIGSSTHMNLERFRLAAGIDLLSVPTKGNSEAITEVMTGRADVYFSPVFSIVPHVKDGRLQALAVGSPKRTAIFPDLPTTVEAGYPNSDYTFWIGALVSSKTPRDIVQRLNREFTAALKFPDVQERMKNLGVDPLNMSIDEFEAMVKKELAENADLVKRAGIKPN